jgi:hypothetical protein
MRKTAFAFVTLLFLLSACAVYYPQPAGPRMPVACTEEAKICPDGSAVGRTGPNCEFAPCTLGGKDYCETDDDCICGGIDTQTGNCFVGSRNYYDLFVDQEKVCPDFCTGIAGDRETRCVSANCMIVKREKPIPVLPSIEIVANPRVGVGPLLVNLTAILRNAESNDKRFYCAPQRWSFGDGMKEEVSSNCVPWFPEADVPTRYNTVHRYEKPGSYNVTFGLGILTSNATVSVLPELMPPECDEDSDCVKAQCCHAVDCVIKEKVPVCKATLCTMDCMPGTLDCGGSCACIVGRCTGQNFLPGKVSREKPIPWGTI